MGGIWTVSEIFYKQLEGAEGGSNRLDSQTEG